MSRINHRLAGLICILFPLLAELPAVTVEIDLRPDHSAKLSFLLAAVANPQQQMLLQNLGREINANFAVTMTASVISGETGHSNSGLQIYLNDVRHLRSICNFVDYHFSKSFFKQKYYMKLLFNEQMFRSKFFQTLRDSGDSQPDYSSLFGGENLLFVCMTFPGRCLNTNMKEDDHGFYYEMSYETILKHGDAVIFDSYRFTPETYLTVLLILAVLAGILIRNLLIWLENRRQFHRQMND